MATARISRARALALGALCAALVRTPQAFADTAAGEIPDLSPLSIEELAGLEITSVSKKAEPVSGAPAAVYVITPDQIRRFGAITTPDALSLAPNLNVRRLDTLNYSISARGFGTFQASNKLLPMIDGRSIYSSLHSGVYWGSYDMLLDDVAHPAKHGDAYPAVVIGLEV